MTNTFLFIEHNANIFDNLSFAFETRYWEIVRLQTEEDVLAHARENSYEFILIDQEYGKINVQNIIPYLHRISNAPILVATQCSCRFSKVFPLLNHSRDSFIRKPISFRELFYKISEIMEKKNNTSENEPATQESMPAFVVDKKRMIISYYKKHLSLTTFQYRILSALLERPGAVFDFETIHNISCRDTESLVDKNTIASHISRIRNPLYTINNKTRLLVSQRGVGYSLLGKNDRYLLKEGFVCFEGEDGVNM